MQMTLAFLGEPEPPASPAQPSPPPTAQFQAAWDQLDEGARTEALGMLAMLIARMLATTATKTAATKTATPATEAGHE